MSPRITVVGSLNMDLIARAPRLPRPGETVLGRDFNTAPGGKGANQAVAAARLGAQVTMVGRVGDDDYGRALLRTMERDGVATEHIVVDREAPTGVALIELNDEGENSIIVISGANMRLTPDDVDAAAATLATSDALLLQLESPLPVVQHAACVARAHGVTVILNPAPARPLPDDFFQGVDYLIPNETEAGLLAGREVGDLSAARDAARALRGKGVRTVILTLGTQGAFIVGQEESHVPAFQVEVVDTTAAGDAFVAGFAVALTRGLGVEEATRYACAAGALAVTRLGAQPSLPTVAETESLLESWKK